MKILLFSFLTLFAISNDSIPKYYLGVGAAYNILNHNSDFQKLPNTNNCCSNFNGGSGSGFEFGVLFRHLVTKNLYFETRFAYSQFDGDLSEKNVNIGPTPIFLNGNLQIQNAISDFNFTSKFQSFRLKPHLSHRLAFDLFMDLGLNLDYIVSSQFSQDELLLSPDGYVFDDTRQLTRNVIENDEIPSLNSIQYAIFAGLSYQIELSNRALIVPEVNYSYRLSNVTNVDWVYNELSLGISYKHPVFKKIKEVEQIKYIRDTSDVYVNKIEGDMIQLIDSSSVSTVEESNYQKLTLTTIKENYQKQILKESEIFSELNVFCVDEEGTKTKSPKVIFEEVETINAFPLLPYIYFKENTSEYLNTNFLNDKNNFSLDTNNSTVFDIYNDNLNIIASRLKEDDKIKLVAIKYGSIPNKVLNSRIKKVKEYFQNVWGLKEKQIKTSFESVRYQNKGQDLKDLIEESNRVEIITPDNVIKPVFLSSLSRKSNPPQVDMIINTYSNISEVEWDLQVYQNKNTIRSFKGNENNRKLSWNVLKAPYPRYNEPIKFKLKSKDESGNEKIVEDSIALDLLTIKRKRTELKEDKRIEKYSLIVFDFNSAELKPIHKEIIGDIKKQLNSNSKIEIIGFTDRIGSSSYNKNLAQERIDNVAKEFEKFSKNLLKNPIGNSKLIYDNDLPQGRSLSRTVQIIIENPIE